MPRGLGLATATTSAAFFPHLEQRIRELTRSSKSSERVARLRSTPSGWDGRPHPPNRHRCAKVEM